jgi:hypothetical protein
MCLTLFYGSTDVHFILVILLMLQVDLKVLDSSSVFGVKPLKYNE